MATFIVKALSLGGLNNKVFNAGDIITDAQVQKENIENLIDQGFIEPVEKAEEADAQVQKDSAKRKEK